MEIFSLATITVVSQDCIITSELCDLSRPAQLPHSYSPVAQYCVCWEVSFHAGGVCMVYSICLSLLAGSGPGAETEQGHQSVLPNTAESIC